MAHYYCSEMVEKAAQTSSDVAIWSLVATMVCILVLLVVFLTIVLRNLAVESEKANSIRDDRSGIVHRPRERQSYDTFDTAQHQVVRSHSTVASSCTTPLGARTPDTIASIMAKQAAYAEVPTPKGTPHWEWLRLYLLPVLQERSREYLAGNWGNDDKFSSTSGKAPLHTLAETCIDGTIDISLLPSLERQIDYREMTMRLAVGWVKAMSLEPPATTTDFDASTWLHSIAEGDVYYVAIHAHVIRAELIPDPKPGQGSGNMKPVVFIAAAVWMKHKESSEAEKVIMAAKSRKNLCAFDLVPDDGPGSVGEDSL